MATEEKAETPAAKGDNFTIGADDPFWGTDLYPERRKPRERSWYKTLSGMQRIENKLKMKCEINVYRCIKNDPLIKLMLGALKSSGCEVDMRRHISCEMCEGDVTGGFDPELNQIVLCENNVQSQSMVRGVMAHEFVHMFDYCRNKLDFKNLDHLACTEIRAANFGHCSFLGAWVQGLASPFNIKQAHQVCVKDKASQSMMAARKISKEVAMEAIERVFDRCYNDMEPIGRRIRRNSIDMERAYAEGHLYGYDL